MRKRGKLHVAFVVPRYGVEITGGAETLARLIAERLSRHVDVTVLTTCAFEYTTWADHYPPGVSELNDVEVLRFPVPRPRDLAEFDLLCAAAYAAPDDLELGRRWLEAEGPVVPGLLEHLAENSNYDVFAFVPYLYATTVQGMPLVADRSALVPAVHDEPPLRLRIFAQVFSSARLLLFSTVEECELAGSRFPIAEERTRVIGVGVSDTPPSDPDRLRASGITRDYVLCVGRLDRSKGVDELVQYHRRYRLARPEGLDLVLVGIGPYQPPAEPWLHTLGFVSEQIKHDALAGAAVIALPSPYESLSLAQLEGWMHERPTLANGATPVLVGQSKRSGGGLWYSDADEYATMLDLLTGAVPLADAIGRQGKRYVDRTHRWERVEEQWLEALTSVAQV